MSQDEQKTYEEGLKFINDHLPSWKDVKMEDVTFSRCSFGLSRATYKVAAKNETVAPNTIILRKFLREAVSATEAPLFELMGQSGLGPKCYYQDLKYRIEEYLPSRLLKAPEVNETEYRRKLAIKLGGIHSLQPELAKDNKKGYIINILDNPQYMKSCREHCLLEDIYTEEEKQQVKDMKYLFEEPEISFVRNQIEKLPVVFSHNDIWVGNILVLEKTNDLVFLDYEVMDWNFPGYDIGKLILEKHYVRHPTQPTYELTPLNEFPSDEDIKDFLKYYLVGRNGGRVVEEGDVLSKYYSKEEAEKEIENLLQQTKLGVVIAGWYCAHLGMRLGKLFTPHFDLIKFAKDGHIVYKHFKALYEKML